MVIIGFSDGYLFAQGIYAPRGHISFLKKSGLSGIEAVAAITDEKRIKMLAAHKVSGAVSFCSVHLTYSATMPIKVQVQKMAKIYRRQKADIAVIHPVAPPEYYTAISACDIPLAIENLNKEAASGIKLKELASLIQMGLFFVLDIQHASEHDPAMEYAWDLFQMGQSVLSHLHISGENHELLRTAKNARAILDFTARVLSEREVPIILEGEYKSLAELTAEIIFIKKELQIF